MTPECLNNQKYFQNNEFSFNYPYKWNIYAEFWFNTFGFDFKPYNDKELNLKEFDGFLDLESSYPFEKFNTNNSKNN